jgi:hypothetical protein
MVQTDDTNLDALCKATADVGRHIAGLAEELAALRHPHAPSTPSPDLIARQINKLRDQAALLTAVVEDIHRSSAAGSPN